MDKHTLSRYGWIVVVIIIIIILLGLAGPFGNFIRSGFREFTFATSDIIEDGLDDYVTPVNYTPDEIEKDPRLYAVGLTKREYVVVKFNNDYSKVTVMRNGSDSDGLMMNWVDANNLSYADRQAILDDYAMSHYGTSYNDIQSTYQDFINNYEEYYLRDTYNITPEDTSEYTDKLANLEADVMMGEFGLTIEEVEAISEDVSSKIGNEEFMAQAVADGICSPDGQELYVSEEEAIAWEKTWVESASNGVFTIDENTGNISINVPASTVATYVENLTDGFYTFDDNYNLIVNVSYEGMNEYINAKTNGAYKYENGSIVFNAPSVDDIISQSDAVSASPFTEHAQTLSKVIVKDGIYSLGNYMFTGCNNINYLDLGATAVIWKDNTFVGLPTALDYLACPFISSSWPIANAINNFVANTQTVKTAVLNGCINSIPENILTKIEARAWEKYQLNNLKYFDFGDYSWCNVLWKNAETVSFTNVNYLPDRSFNSCTKLHSVDLNGVTMIDEAFLYCSSLTNVVIPESVKYLNYSFDGCNSLINMTLPATLMYCCAPFGYENSTVNATLEYNPNCYYGGLSACVKNIVFPAGTASFNVAKDASKNDIYTVWNEMKIGHTGSLEKITSIQLPESIREIGFGAFYNFTSLESITLPTAITYIPNSAFQNCSSLKNIYIPDSVTDIGGNAFLNCSALENIRLSENLKCLRKNTFGDCGKLAELIVPDSVERTNPDSFEKYIISGDCGKYYTGSIDAYSITPNCKSLKNIIVGSGLKEIPADLFGRSSALETVYIKDGPISIEDMAFSDCKNLKSIRLPNTLKTIGYQAFFNCYSIEELIIPDSVELIYQQAFGNLSSLKNITLPITARGVIQNKISSSQWNSSGKTTYMIFYGNYAGNRFNDNLQNVIFTGGSAPTIVDSEIIGQPWRYNAQATATIVPVANNFTHISNNNTASPVTVTFKNSEIFKYVYLKELYSDKITTFIKVIPEIGQGGIAKFENGNYNLSKWYSSGYNQNNLNQVLSKIIAPENSTAHQFATQNNIPFEAN